MSSAQLNINHLVVLSQSLPAPISELGPAPATLPEDADTVVRDHLVTAGLTTAGGDLTEVGRSVLEPLHRYDEAFSGVLLLHNERQPVRFTLDDTWREYGLHRAFSDIPRVFIHITHARDNVATCAVRRGHDVTITQRRIAGSFAGTAAALLWSIADPHHQWQPFTELGHVSVPVAALENAPARRPDPTVTDDDTRHRYQRYVSDYVTTLRTTHGLDPRSAAAVHRFLNLDHVASLQMIYTAGPQRKSPSASAGVEFFHPEGAAVTHPRRLADGSMRRVFAPASVPALGRALESLAELPGAPRSPIRDALAGNPTKESLIPQHLRRPTT